MKKLTSKANQLVMIVAINVSFLSLTSFRNMQIDDTTLGENNNFKIIAGTGDYYRVDETNDIETTLGAAGKLNTNKTEFKNTLELHLSFPYEIDKDYNSVIQFDTLFSESKRYINGVMSKLNEPQSPFEKSKKALMGTFFQVKFDDVGKIVQFQGYDNFKNKFVTLYDNELKKQNQIEQNKLHSESAVYRQSYFTDLFEKITNNLPNNPIELNSQWKKIEPILNIDGRKFITDYTCYKIEEGIAFIKSHTEVDDTLSSNNTKIEMHGTQEGMIEIEIKTGKLIHSKKELTMKGSTKIGNADFFILKKRTLLIERLKHTEFSRG